MSKLIFRRILISTSMARAMITHNPPLLSPQFAPTWSSPTTATAATTSRTMILSVLFGFVLMFVGMGVVYMVYMFLSWFFVDSNNNGQPMNLSVVTGKGLSDSELEKLPRVRGRELVMESECAVCLDEIESEEAARVLPGCNHGFHVQCADTWLSKQGVCPLCRAKLHPLFFNTH